VLDLLNMPWKMLLLRGAIGVLFGILAMVWPLETAIALALLWGIWAVVDGIGLGMAAFAGGSGGQKALAIGMAVLALIAGIFAIFHPGLTAAALTWVLGIWLIVRGLFEIFGAFAPGLGSARWVLVLTAIIDLVLGVIFVSNPGKSAVGLAFLLGLIALVWGVVLVIGAFVVRSQVRDLAGDQPASTV
jgi:uncharacterized membrane protein HdeD (DUF308 family)